jgi:hypothetical protein
MSKEATWFGTAVGVSAGILVWVVGLDKSLCPAHPEWFLLAVTLFVAAVSAVMIQRGERPGPEQVHKVS